MKANEAPENIYLLPDNRNSTGLSICWYEAPYCTGSVEYVNKDAFIEKAVNFLEMLGCGFIITDNITHTNYDKEQLIEDFRKYMEGE